MKYILVATFASVIGGIVGSLASPLLSKTHAGGAPDLVVAKEILLLDERGQPAARLMRSSGSTLLRFYNADSSVAVEIGTRQQSPDRYLAFFGKNGQPLASLYTAPNGDTNLSLRNESARTHIVLGAFPSDEPTDEPTREWGLQVWGGSVGPMFSALVKASKDLTPSTAGVLVRQKDGKAWGVP